jgi:hypothetical protein
MEGRGGVYRICWGDVMVKIHLEDLGLDGSIILICISKKLDGEAWTGLL